MGANESKQSYSTDNESTSPSELPVRCLYEVLGVDLAASDDQIKKAYRNKAFEVHPDRNFGNAEAATLIFAELQSAYEVLSDPNERAWYDSHRDTILNTSVRPDGAGEHLVRASAQDVIDLMRQYNAQARSGNVVQLHRHCQVFFSSIAVEENQARFANGDDRFEYPPFWQEEGMTSSNIESFYAIWSGFSTQKDFSWKDIHKPLDGADRRYRRAVEKDNRRLREQEAREFNEAVRSLVRFLRRRDSRIVLNQSNEIERQRTLRDIAKAQAARSRATNVAKLTSAYNPSPWAVISSGESETSMEDEADDHIRAEIECVPCKKIFKSEPQYRAHENSKKHKKTTHLIARLLQQRSVEEPTYFESPSSTGPKVTTTTGAAFLEATQQ